MTLAQPKCVFSKVEKTASAFASVTMNEDHPLCASVVIHTHRDTMSSIGGVIDSFAANTISLSMRFICNFIMWCLHEGTV